MTTRIGSFRLGSESIAGTFVRTPPSAVLTAPGSTIDSTPVTVSWTYGSVVGRPQAAYRIRFLSQGGDVTVYDTGNIPGSAGTADVAVVLSGGSTYKVEVTVFDGYDWSPPATSYVTFDAADVTDTDDEKAVGSVYEVAINGVGYMLADHPDRELRYERRTVPLDPPRFATGDTPFSQAIDRYTQIGMIDWSAGAGQRFFDREQSVPNGYWTSTGINPFGRGELRLVKDASLHHSDSYTTQFAVVASGRLLYSTGTGELSAFDDPSDTSATTVSITGASDVLDMASDGTFWYFADGANIYRNSTATDPGSAWSTENAELIEWCTDRIVIAKKGGSSTTPNVVAVLSEAGSEVGGSEKWTFQEGTHVRSITAGDGYVWWAASRGGKSTVFAWKLGSTDSYFTALELPAGQDARSIGFYQGNVFIRTSETTGSSQTRAVIYRCAASEGRLLATRLLEIDDTSVDHGSGDWAGDDRFVYFSWKTMGAFSGIGCIDLSTGGWSKWTEGPGGTGLVRSIVQWYGRTAWTVDGYGLVVEDGEGGDDGTVAEGSLYTSVSDLGTGLRKVYTKIQASFDPLPAGAELELAYSLDAGNSYTPLTAVTAAGQKYASWSLNVESDSLALKATLRKGAVASPVLRTVTVRANPVGLADQVLTLVVNCADSVAGLNQRPLPQPSHAGAGAARARALEDLVQSRVRVQDVDWAVSKTAQVYDLVAVEVRGPGVFNQHVNRQQQAQVAICTLRRSFK